MHPRRYPIPQLSYFRVLEPLSTTLPSSHQPDHKSCRRKVRHCRIPKMAPATAQPQTFATIHQNHAIHATVPGLACTRIASDVLSVERLPMGHRWDGPGGITVYSLRHTYATMALWSGVDLRTRWSTCTTSSLSSIPWTGLAAPDAHFDRESKKSFSYSETPREAWIWTNRHTSSSFSRTPVIRMASCSLVPCQRSRQVWRV